MKPEEKAAEKWWITRKRTLFIKRSQISDVDVCDAFLAGVKWEREQVLKERLDKWDGKNLKKEARKDGKEAKK